MRLFTDLDTSLEEFHWTASVPALSSVAVAIAIVSAGAVVLATTIMGIRLRGRKSVKPEPPVAPKETPIVQVEPVAPAAPIPPPPSKTSGLHFVPAAVGAVAQPASRRFGGNYVRRAPPKRSTATRQKQEDQPS